VKVKFLGKNQGISSYSPELLDSVDRNNIPSMLSYFGYDLWTAYEFSYLNSSNHPVLAILEIKIPMTTKQTVESKSLKLYLASFYKRKFTKIQNALKIIERDLSNLLGGTVKVKTVQKLLHPPKSQLITSHSRTIARNKIIRFEGFRSVCPVTSQPDWATIYFHSVSDSINAQELSKLLKSYREQGDFHETCIENIFLKLYKDQNLLNLTIFGRFLRRGGIDINPMRSTHKKRFFNHFTDAHQ
jgi:7-cyano-7-deazaguanine reductase